MKKIQSMMIKILFALANLILFVILSMLLVNYIIIFEVFLALVLMQFLFSGFFFLRYLFYKKCQQICRSLGFRLVTTGFLEQARLEGVYKKNWWQIHFASRDYGSSWGVPRTYIKLQFKESKKFDKKILKKYTNYAFENLQILNIEHIVRPYKNYLLLRVNWYILRKSQLLRLMDFLVKISKEAKFK